MIFLDDLFNEFCNHFDGKLKWEKPKGKTWTDSIFHFFSELNKEPTKQYLEAREYMSLDYVWRYGPPRYSMCDIELALEHEGETYKTEEIIADEIRHLVDVKARHKVAIFYPSAGDEVILLEKIAKTIEDQSDIVRLEQEKYLIILGYATTKESKRAIMFKGFLFDSRGRITQKLERVVPQVAARS